MFIPTQKTYLFIIINQQPKKLTGQITRNILSLSSIVNFTLTNTLFTQLKRRPTLVIYGTKRNEPHPDENSTLPINIVRLPGSHKCQIIHEHPFPSIAPTKQPKSNPFNALALELSYAHFC